MTIFAMMKNLTVNTATVEKQSHLHSPKKDDQYQHSYDVSTPRTEASTPSSTSSYYHPVRGQSDIRSPGISRTPSTDDKQSQNHVEKEAPIPDFITQTDKDGNATTPRSQSAITAANNDESIEKSDTDETEVDQEDPDACDTLLESLRMMCCCLLPESDPSIKVHDKVVGSGKAMQITKQRRLGGAPAYGHLDETATFYENSKIKLLPSIVPEDRGKKCLVLDLDETLVHSSFRAVSGADFVIPVQIEDVVHYVYVAKRPGVDQFLLEMAKHYEIILYTASLNKYADPLLDLLDPHRTIRTRLFRESCVYYEGNYVKDLSLLNRDLSTTIIVDNSPASYIFHPENAIDCSSFIDDPADRELKQIADFLKGVKDVKDVRAVCNLWRDWPNIQIDDFAMDKDESREDKHVQ